MRSSGPKMAHQSCPMWSNMAQLSGLTSTHHCMWATREGHDLELKQKHTRGMTTEGYLLTAAGAASPSLKGDLAPQHVHHRLKDRF